jgi:hypothetical protein
MDTKGLRQAWDRFHRAEAAKKDMARSSDLAALESAWNGFLLAANAVYSKLEKAASASSRSKSWFGNKKHERDQDALLRPLEAPVSLMGLLMVGSEK